MCVCVFYHSVFKKKNKEKKKERERERERGRKAGRQRREGERNKQRKRETSREGGREGAGRSTRKREEGEREDAAIPALPTGLLTQRLQEQSSAFCNESSPAGHPARQEDLGTSVLHKALAETWVIATHPTLASHSSFRLSACHR